MPFFVRIGGISGDCELVEVWFVFWREVVKPKYPWRDQTNLIRRRTKVRLDIYLARIRPSEHDTVTISGQGLDIAEYQGSTHGSVR